MLESERLPSPYLVLSSLALFGLVCPLRHRFSVRKPDSISEIHIQDILIQITFQLTLLIMYNNITAEL